MTLTALEPPPMADDLAAFHNAQLGHLLSLPPGADRAVATVAYLALLEEWAEEAIAVRDVEVWRLKLDGWGPTQLGRTLGLSKSRGGQLLDRAEESHGAAQRLVTKLKRRVGVRAGLRSVDETP